MSAKRKTSSLPPPRSPSSSSDDDDSSSEEEQAVATPTPSLAKTPKTTEQASNKSDSDSESESEAESESGSDPEPPKATPTAPLKPSNSDSSADETEEESEEEPKLTAEKSESEPDKKKLKVSAPEQSPSVKSSSAFLRIWSDEDEMAILKALSEYHARNGQLPLAKDYAGFLSTVSSSIGFPVTEKQLGNKIQQFKRAYDKKIKKGSDVNLSKPHDKAVFEMCAKLFEGRSSKAVSEKKAKLESNGVLKMESHGAANGYAMGQAANGGVVDSAGTSRSYNYLEGFIEELIKEKQCPGGLSAVEDAIALIGEPMAKQFEAEIKPLKIDMLKLSARKAALRAELYDIIADQLADD